jgi:rhodanese-related sulfurtransferase
MVATISATALYAQLGLPTAPTLVDVRSEADLRASGRFIPGALRADVDQLAGWANRLPRNRAVTVYCSHGAATSTGAARTLAGLGFSTMTLEGGFEAWSEGERVTVAARPELKVPGHSRWVTRERPKIDRLACPWLIRRFIDPEALFFYVPAHRVRTDATTLDAEPYDITDVRFSHRGERCSFDAFLDEFELSDPVLQSLAAIVRAADTNTLERAPQAPGLLAISLGLSANVSDDIVLLEQAMPLYDALYAWCKTARNETHAWPQTAAQAQAYATSPQPSQ